MLKSAWEWLTMNSVQWLPQEGEWNRGEYGGGVQLYLKCFISQKENETIDAEY